MFANSTDIQLKRRKLVEGSELTQIIFDIRGASTKCRFPKFPKNSPPVGHRERVNKALGINPSDSIRKGKSDAGIPLLSNAQLMFDDYFLESNIAELGFGFSHGLCMSDKRDPDKFRYKIFFDKGSTSKLPEKFQEYLMGSMFSLHIWANLDIPIDQNGNLTRVGNDYKIVSNNVFTLVEQVSGGQFIVSEKPGQYHLE